MRSQSVAAAVGRARMAGGDAGLQRVGPERVAAQPALGALQRRQAAADQQVVPARAVLVAQQHRAALGVDAGGGA